MKKLIAIAALLSAGAAQAQMALPVYAEIGYTAVKYSEDGFGDDIKPGILRGILGVEVHPNIAIEAMAGTGVKDDTIRFQGMDVETKVSRSYGFYVKPQIKPTSDLTLFARLGYADTKLKASISNASISESDNDVSYGVGLGYALSSRAYVAADYMSYYDKDGSKAAGFTLGVGFRF